MTLILNELHHQKHYSRITTRIIMLNAKKTLCCIIKCTTIKVVINFDLQDAFWIVRRRTYLISLLYVLISFCALWCVTISSCLIGLDIILGFIRLQISSQNGPYIISKIYLLHYIWTLFMISFSPSNVYGKHMLKRYKFLLRLCHQKTLFPGTSCTRYKWH